MDLVDCQSAPRSTEPLSDIGTDASDVSPPLERQQHSDVTPPMAPDQSQSPSTSSPPIVVVRDGRYCHVTGCVLVPIVVDGVRVMTNWVMSSTDNIIAPSASARMTNGTVAHAQASAETPRTLKDDMCLPDASTARGVVHDPTSPTLMASSHNAADGADVRRAWPTVCRALGTVYRPHAISIGGACIQAPEGAPDTGIHFLRAHAVRVSSLSCVQLAHRVAQAHSSIMSVARPTSHEPPAVLGRLVADGIVQRPSVLWDMRARTQTVTVAMGVAAPINDPNTALVRLYRPEHPDVIAAGESIVALARAGALVRVLGIEVAVSPEAPTMRLPLDTPEWAMIDVGVRACYFDQETRRAVVDALARVGPPSWRASPLWARGTVLAHEADGVLGLACQQAPVLALVLSGHDPARPVRLRMGRDAYAHATPVHEVRYRWPDPDDRPPDRENNGNDPRNDHRNDHRNDSRNNNDDNDDIVVQLQYAQIDLASWMNRSPGGTCLIGNCAFQGRAVLVDYEADVMAVFSGGPP
nr:hypothetical protein [Pandoravirus aubagnensis]